jgi:hypothetical protein
MLGKTIANDISDVDDICGGLVDGALPPDVRQVCDLPSKVQFLFLGLCPVSGVEPLEVGLKSRVEGQRPSKHLSARALT